ncbi:hypothetical protein FYK55_27970 [Roseiconus nitratireducens]|uniref:Uncharacterized protein n=1 Tax=Roseiconus nitratireducens TaxID=2605748 RepID=A0A5M6CSK8_9BACT|nr:hypothetical protein [Roseiconus nitratireducens]KAA5537983.1 hypothetical protein FYK55_27970 [Roseiconus nitratireducens]
MIALQVYVRNFATQHRGERIVAQLESLGFTVKECYDGTLDSLGGLIETHITSVDELKTDDPDDIRALVSSDPEVFLQFRVFSVIHEGEVRLTSKLRIVSDDQ